MRAPRSKKTAPLPPAYWVPMLPLEILADKQLSDADKVLLLALLGAMRPKEGLLHTKATNKHLAAAIGRSVKSVKERLTSLTGQGFIQVTTSYPRRGYGGRERRIDSYVTAPSWVSLLPAGRTLVKTDPVTDATPSAQENIERQGRAAEHLGTPGVPRDGYPRGTHSTTTPTVLLSESPAESRAPLPPIAAEEGAATMNAAGKPLQLARLRQAVGTQSVPPAEPSAAVPRSGETEPLIPEGVAPKAEAFVASLGTDERLQVAAARVKQASLLEHPPSSKKAAAAAFAAWQAAGSSAESITALIVLGYYLAAHLRLRGCPVGAIRVGPSLAAIRDRMDTLKVEDDLGPKFLLDTIDLVLDKEAFYFRSTDPDVLFGDGWSAAYAASIRTNLKRRQAATKKPLQLGYGMKFDDGRR